MWTTLTMMTISKLSQHTQSPTHSVNRSPSYLENCNWSIISVFDCRRPCTVLSMLQEDGTTVYVDDFILACSDSSFGKHVFESINSLYEWGKWESRVFKQCGAQITQAYNKHTGTWCGFEISFTEYGKEISIITLPSHRRRDRKSKSTPLELSQLRALNGQLLWLGMQCLPQLLAPLSLLMGQTPQATVGTIYKVNKLARKATAWARAPLKIHVHHSPVVVTYTDAGWTTRPDGTSQGGQLVFIANYELLQGREIKHTSDILAIESMETGGKIFVCSRDSSSGRRR